MPINITMPALSPTMEEGNLAKWLVKVGDSVSSGDVIAEIETDKATMEVEAVDEGTVAKILVDEGTEGVKVNAIIAVLAGEGENPEDAAKSATGAAPAEERTASTDSADAPAQPPAAAPVAIDEARQPRADEPDGRVFSSPLARRMARDAGLEIAAITGSGPKGRVVKRDVESALATGQAGTIAPSAAPTAAPGPKPVSDEAVLKLFEEGSYELVPHDGMRKTIARRLVESKQNVPHFYLTLNCELDALLGLRKQLNDAAPVRDDKPAYKISVNDIVIKAMALALRDVPDANASWTDSNMVMHRHSDVGVAVAIPGGLITPIVRRAEEKGLSTIANEMKDLASRARDRKLLPQEYQGGTTAVSNLGMFGISEFSAVINPPHSTILAVGAGEQRPIVRDGAVATATVMTVTLSTDHRAVDGALGAQLLQAFKHYIENPIGMLV
jgi:pyruvate dehydrogenase E2 component (dihydrolipoamide acetyltransferase)